MTTWMLERMKDSIVVASNTNVVNSVSITANEREYNNTVKYLETLVTEYGYNSQEEMMGIKTKDIYADPEDRWKHLGKLEKYGFLRSFVSNCKKRSNEFFYTERTANLIKMRMENLFLSKELSGILPNKSYWKKS